MVSFRSLPLLSLMFLVANSLDGLLIDIVFFNNIYGSNENCFLVLVLIFVKIAKIHKVNINLIF